jgi:hypothetical protein
MKTSIEAEIPQVQKKPSAIYLLRQLLTLSLTTPSRVADIFLTYSPHIGMVFVQIFKGGWSSEKGAVRLEADAYNDGEIVSLFNAVMGEMKLIEEEME